MNKLYFRSWWSTILFTLAFNLNSQDLHYSQFINSPANLNPGLTGAFSGDMRFVSNLKPQWNSVPVSYLQMTASIDTRFFNKDETGPLAVGLYFDYDQAGDSKLTFLQLSFTGSYSFKFDKKRRNYLTIGLTGSAVQRSFDFFKLNFDSQYVPEVGVDFTRDNGEIFDKTKVVFGDFATGINLHLAAPFDRSNMDIGLGVFHVNEPSKGFLPNTEIHLGRRYSGYFAGTKVINSHMDILTNVVSQYQVVKGNETSKKAWHRELIIGTGTRRFLVSRPTKLIAVEAGIMGRLSGKLKQTDSKFVNFFTYDFDALIPYLGYHFNGWKITLSYDINLSPFHEATLGLGGMEVSAIYIIADVPFKSYCPHCPAFL